MPPLPPWLLWSGLLAACFTFCLRQFAPRTHDRPQPFACSILKPDGARYDFRFAIERHEDGLRVRILTMPPYAPRNDDPHITHRLLLLGGHYVCWSRPLATTAEARRIAALWAEKTAEYIRSGQLF